MSTKPEFIMAILLMFTGVIFYSQILTELLDLINRSLRKQDTIQQKLQNLREVKRELKMPDHIEREMVRIIEDNFKPQEKEQLKIDTINPRDWEQLQYEAFKNKLSGIRMFNSKNKAFMIKFASNMKKVKFEQEKTIWFQGDSAEFFYVLKSGVVEYRIDNENSFPLPFVRIEEGYFGEYELLKGEQRRFLCVAATDVKCYAISKEDFIELFINGDRDIHLEFRDRAHNRNERFDKMKKKTEEVLIETVDKINLEYDTILKKNPLLRLQNIIRGQRFTEVYGIKFSGKQAIHINGPIRSKARKRTHLFKRQGNTIDDEREKEVLLGADRLSKYESVKYEQKISFHPHDEPVEIFEDDDEDQIDEQEEIRKINGLIKKKSKRLNKGNK